jgi:hypothetical protein
MRDPRKDPRPGDVVRIKPEWERHVMEVSKEHVLFCAYINGIWHNNFVVDIEMWRRGFIPESEVVHVAE